MIYILCIMEGASRAEQLKKLARYGAIGTDPLATVGEVQQIYRSCLPLYQDWAWKASVRVAKTLATPQEAVRSLAKDGDQSVKKAATRYER